IISFSPAKSYFFFKLGAILAVLLWGKGAFPSGFGRWLLGGAPVAAPGAPPNSQRLPAGQGGPWALVVL
ncbi:MAG TPA: hypothetical protein PKD90_13140, partial [Phnomibacter sp.]|nr:hypothetical protein [Phnomibacter sp.]